LTSRSRERALAASLAAGLVLFAAIAALAPGSARAQACCAAASAIGTARLAPHEDAVAGIGARAVALYASMDRKGNYVPSPGDAIEIGFEQDIAATMRVLRHGQLTVIVPLVETYRAAAGLSELGGGFGDMRLGARYDFIEPGASPKWPGIALSFGLTLPTGRAPEAASTPLATGSTGTGSLQASAQIQLERSFGDVFVIAAGSADWRSPRVVGDHHGQRGPSFSAFMAAGDTFKSGLVAALTLSYTAEIEGRSQGARVPESGYELTRVGLAGGYSFTDEWRIQASLYSDVPIPLLARNQPLGGGLTVMLLRSSW
jgi:Putative MetA-pathway of phenol degradation